jgi:hypothetical protein
MYKCLHLRLDSKLPPDLLPTTTWELETTSLVEKPASSTLLVELEWHAATMMSEWVLLLTAVRVIGIISVIVSLP